MLTNELKTLQLLKWLSKKLYTGVNWFSDSVQAGIFVAEHEVWIKKECIFVKKITYYMYHKTLEHGLKS